MVSNDIGMQNTILRRHIPRGIIVEVLPWCCKFYCIADLWSLCYKRAQTVTDNAGMLSLPVVFTEGLHMSEYRIYQSIIVQSLTLIGQKIFKNKYRSYFESRYM